MSLNDSQYNILIAEIQNDPESRGYLGSPTMSDQEIADDLNTVYRTRNKTSITGSEVFEQTDATEYDALTDVKKSQWLSFCGISILDPFGSGKDVVIEIFGGGSNTVTNLNNIRIENITRANELGLPTITIGHVESARLQGGL
jgi:hypothetical protein